MSLQTFNLDAFIGTYGNAIVGIAASFLVISFVIGTVYFWREIKSGFKKL